MRNRIIVRESEREGRGCGGEGKKGKERKLSATLNLSCSPCFEVEFTSPSSFIKLKDRFDSCTVSLDPQCEVTLESRRYVVDCSNYFRESNCFRHSHEYVNYYFLQHAIFQASRSDVSFSFPEFRASFEHVA